ncbi:hypothetical protein K505DRAFT_381785, partial [Melanomma pulvis-pyrius CBS 109.77]
MAAMLWSTSRAATEAVPKSLFRLAPQTSRRMDYWIREAERQEHSSSPQGLPWDLQAGPRPLALAAPSSSLTPCRRSVSWATASTVLTPSPALLPPSSTLSTPEPPRSPLVRPARRSLSLLSSPEISNLSPWVEPAHPSWLELERLIYQQTPQEESTAVSPKVLVLTRRQLRRHHGPIKER